MTQEGRASDWTGSPIHDSPVPEWRYTVGLPTGSEILLHYSAICAPPLPSRNVLLL